MHLAKHCQVLNEMLLIQLDLLIDQLLDLGGYILFIIVQRVRVEIFLFYPLPIRQQPDFKFFLLLHLLENCLNGSKIW